MHVSRKRLVTGPWAEPPNESPNTDDFSRVHIEVRGAYFTLATLKLRARVAKENTAGNNEVLLAVQGPEQPPRTGFDQLNAAQFSLG